MCLCDRGRETVCVCVGVTVPRGSPVDNNVGRILPTTKTLKRKLRASKSDDIRIAAEMQLSKTRKKVINRKMYQDFFKQYKYLA